MKQILKRSISIVTVVMLIMIMCFTSVSAKTTATGYKRASDVDYQFYNTSSASQTYAVSKGVKNWGARDEVCVFLSTYANKYYTGSNTYTKLSQLKGGSGQTNAPGTELYEALQTLMEINFTHNYQKTRGLYKYTDCVSNNDTKLVSFYSGTLVNSTWDSGATYNREHCWPDSKCLESGRSSGDSADMHMLRPTKSSENGSRGNKAYGTGSGYFEPDDEVKGDCARIVLYGYVRWGNTGKMWGTSGVMQDLKTLLKWMEEDPVDTWEMGRNDAVQSITGNRNVFVDYPELAWLLFGQEIPDDMTTPSGEAKSSGGNQGGNDNNDDNNNQDSGNQGTTDKPNVDNDNNDNVNNDNNNQDNNNNNTDNDDNSDSNDNTDNETVGGTTSKPNNGGKPYDPNNIVQQQVMVEDEDTTDVIFVIGSWEVDTLGLVLIIAGAVVLLGGIAAVTIVLIKKKKS